MSTLEGAVPLGLGITKLRLWDELHRAHCEDLQQSHPLASASSRPDQQISQHCDASAQTRIHRGESHHTRSTTVSSKRSHEPDALSTRHKQRRVVPPLASNEACAIHINVEAASLDIEPSHSYPTGCMNWLLTHRDSSQVSIARANNTNQATNKAYHGPARDSQGVLMPPPPPKPGPSRRKPPPLVARIKAKARRAKRKQQKAEHRRRLFLAHMVQATQSARQQNAAKLPSSPSSIGNPLASDRSKPKESTAGLPLSTQRARPAPSVFPESLGVDLDSFVEIVFDTDAQSSEITAPSDISDDDLAWATRTEIENRKKLGGADVMVPKGVFRWMVARDFAAQWPQKVKDVRKNPWPGLEDVWGSPSGGAATERTVDQSTGRVERDGEPVRWQSGRRSGFIRRKEKAASPTAVQVEASLTQVRTPDRLGIEATSLPQTPTSAAAAATEVSSVMSKASVQYSPMTPAHLSTVPPSSLVKPSKTEPYGSSMIPGCTASEMGPSSRAMTPRTQANKVNHPFGMSDTFASSWDWSSAFTCSRSTAPPSTLAGLPISL